MRVNIQLAQSVAASIVNTSGRHVNIITDDQRRIFNIQDRQIRDAVTRIRGRQPNDVFVRSPTNPPLTVDLYSSFNWAQVQANFDILDAEVLEMSSEPVIVDRTELVNLSEKGPATFHANLSATVTDTVSSNWQVEHGISAGQSVNYSVGAFGGETSFTYSHTWGEGGEHSRSVALSTGAGVEVELQPGQGVVVNMISNRGRARVRVRYLSRLTGGVATNYNPRHDGSHFWQCPVEQVMENVPMRREIITTENLNIDMFTSTRIELRDKENNRLLRSFRRTSTGHFVPDYIHDIPGRPTPEL